MLLKGLFIYCFRCVAVARVIDDRDCLQDNGTKCSFLGFHVNFTFYTKSLNSWKNQKKSLLFFFNTCVLEC